MKHLSYLATCTVLGAIAGFGLAGSLLGVMATISFVALVVVLVVWGVEHEAAR